MRGSPVDRKDIVEKVVLIKISHTMNLLSSFDLISKVSLNMSTSLLK